MVARIDLKPGDTVIFDNHRALHARDSFKVPSACPTLQEITISVLPTRYQYLSVLCPEYLVMCQNVFDVHYRMKILPVTV